MQAAGPSKAGGPSLKPHGDTVEERTRIGSAAGRTQNPQTKTARAPQLIALKDGDPIPEGYTFVVGECHEHVASGRTQLQSACETVDLTTPPKATYATGAEGPESEKSKLTRRQNLARNTNMKANTSFAKELKESLATGRPTSIKVAAEQTDLKGAWHAAAKEIAYKLLDLRKESWKDYSIFEKSVVHKELNELILFDPLLDPKRIDKFLSCHLRTLRVV
jgi:hypothetical protein